MHLCCPPCASWVAGPMHQESRVAVKGASAGDWALLCCEAELAQMCRSPALGALNPATCQFCTWLALIASGSRRKGRTFYRSHRRPSLSWPVSLSASSTLGPKSNVSEGRCTALSWRIRAKAFATNVLRFNSCRWLMKPDPSVPLELEVVAISPWHLGGRLLLLPLPLR